MWSGLLHFPGRVGALRSSMHSLKGCGIGPGKCIAFWVIFVVNGMDGISDKAVDQSLVKLSGSGAQAAALPSTGPQQLGKSDANLSWWQRCRRRRGSTCTATAPQSRACETQRCLGWQAGVALSALLSSCYLVASRMQLWRLPFEVKPFFILFVIAGRVECIFMGSKSPGKFDMPALILCSHMLGAAQGSCNAQSHVCSWPLPAKGWHSVVSKCFVECFRRDDGSANACMLRASFSCTKPAITFVL